MIQFRIKYPYEYKLAKRSEITYYCDMVHEKLIAEVALWFKQVTLIQGLHRAFIYSGI